MSEHDDYARSRMSFRPSVYSTGVEPVQSYTPVWPEGQEYGAWYSPDQLYKYTPIGYVYDKYMTEKEESAGGLCTDWDGALGKKGAQVSCHELAQKMGLKGAGEGEFSPSDLLPTAVQEVLGIEDKPGCDEDCQRKKKWKQALGILVPLIGVVGGVVAYQRYQKTGKII